MIRHRFALLALAPLTLAAAPLTLRESADLALRKNLGLAVRREDTGIADDRIEVARAEFDALFNFNTGVRESRTAGADYVSRSPLTQSWDNTASLSKKFSTGTTVTLESGFAPTWGRNQAVSPEYRTVAGASVSQPLLKNGGESVNLAPLARARLNLERTKVNLRIAAVDLITDTAVAYRNMSAARDLLALRESGLLAAEKLLAEVKARHQPGIGTSTLQDELQAASDVAARRVEVAQARRDMERAGDILRDLLGENPARNQTSEPPEVARLPAEPPAIPDFVTFMTEVGRFNPEAELRDIDRRDAETALDAALNQDAPSLDLVAGARSLGRDDSAWGGVEGLRRDHGYELSAGLRFTLPLGMREAEANLRAARRAREQALLREADTRRRVGYSARAAWRDLIAARDRLAAAETGLALQTRAYDGERSRNQRGLSSLNDVLQAAARLDRARLDRLSAALDCATADIRRARLDGDILTQLGYRWSEIDDSSGADAHLTAAATR